MKADLLNHIGNVRPGEAEILKSSSKAVKISGLGTSKKCASGGRQLGIDVNRWGARLAFCHASAVIHGEFLLQG
jgi:hypothetical protein